VLAALFAGDGRRCLLGVVHLGRDAFLFPCCEDARVKVDDICSSFADLIAVEEDVVVVVVENHGDVQLFADRKKIVDRVADVVVLEDETVLDGVG
jgi:hypothetical protein